MKSKVFFICLFLTIFLSNTSLNNTKLKSSNSVSFKNFSKKSAFKINEKNDPLIFINDKLILFDSQPYIESNLYIPLIPICKALNITYKNNFSDTLISKNNKFLTIETASIKNEVIYITYNQLVKILNLFEIDHLWDSSSKVLNLYYNIYNNNFDKEDAIANVSLIFNDTSQGSCVVVDEHTVYTCWHVIKNFNYDIDSLTIADKNIKLIGLRKVVNNDLAILDVDIMNYRDYPKLNKAYKWNKVTTIGFPNTSFSITTGQITKINHYHKYTNDINATLEIQSDAEIYHGSSGGALFNSNYELIGITDAFDKTYSYSLPVR